MTPIAIELGDEDTRQLDEQAAQRGMTRAALATRWVEERLLHERERAARSGAPPAPRD